jgi:hypothetical protein
MRRTRRVNSSKGVDDGTRGFVGRKISRREAEGGRESRV